MFGYVKPYRPTLRVCEDELYKGIYCGLCKTLDRIYGSAATFSLSYDFVFLTVFHMALNGEELDCKNLRCPLHLINKTNCVCVKNGKDPELEYAAAAEVILTYHKLRDDVSDKGIKSRLSAAALLPLMRKPYKKAKRFAPTLAGSVEEAMRSQKRLERLAKTSLDAACEPTAAMMRSVFRQLGEFDPDKRELLGDFGYMLGRYVYICDALDDLNADYKNGSFNPLLPKKVRLLANENLPKSYRAGAAKRSQESVFMTISVLTDIYEKLEFKSLKPILDNVVYIGLKDTFLKIKEKTIGQSGKR